MDREKLKELVNQENLFMRCNGIQIAEIGSDYARAELEITPESKNIYGVVHGGVYYTMADCAAGSAARSNGGQYVTLNSSINYIRSAASGAIKAEAEVLHRGRTTCILKVQVTGEDEVLYADGTFTMFCLEPPEAE